MTKAMNFLRHLFESGAWFTRTAVVGLIIAPGIVMLFLLVMSFMYQQSAPSILAAEIVAEIQSWGSPTTTGNIMVAKCEEVGAPTVSDEGRVLLPSPICERWGAIEVTSSTFASGIGKYLVLGYALLSLPGLLLAFVLELGGYRRTQVDVRIAEALAGSRSSSSSLPPRNSHLTEGDGFDFEEAKVDVFGCYYRDSSDHFRRAIGKPDWAPISVVLSSIGALHAGSATVMNPVLQTIIRDSGLPYDAPQADDWWDANHAHFRHVHGAFESYELNQGDDFNDENKEIYGFEGLSFYELIQEFFRAYQMRYPSLPFEFGSSTEALVGFHNSDVFKETRSAADGFFNQVNAWAQDRFVSCGLTVDTQCGLVKLEGYQPLYLASANDSF
ncbi:hypothetical protein [Pseudomonas aeruginosa]|uniref:hypothetical protein n=1 Tax=Pseudomonas aeruginosa TaxID=287 RepID=UPI000F52D4C3|nr:hypothetical protein [Pseudomonas aeruginosa]